MDTETAHKIVTQAQLELWRVRLREERVVAVAGCFDLLHPGHVELLERAKTFGHYLVVGIKSDASVRQLKGDDRPLVPQADRARVVAALKVVDLVYIFDEPGIFQFLQVCRPHVWARGGDCGEESLDPAEREAASAVGAAISIVPLLPSKSTTVILRRIGRKAVTRP